jgi:translation initiation factor 1A
LKYTPDEARLLKSYGEIPDNMKVNEEGGEGGPSGDEDVEIDFDIDEI